MHAYALKMWGKVIGDKNLEARYVERRWYVVRHA